MLSGLIGAVRVIPNLTTITPTISSRFSAAPIRFTFRRTSRGCVRERSALESSDLRSTRATGSSMTASSCSYRGSFPSRCPNTFDTGVAMNDGPAWNQVDELQVLLDRFSRMRSANASACTPIKCFPTRRGGSSRPGSNTAGETWTACPPRDNGPTQPWLVLQNYQRHLLQVGYVDALIGRVLHTLDRAGSTSDR